MENLYHKGEECSNGRWVELSSDDSEEFPNLDSDKESGVEHASSDYTEIQIGLK